LTFIYLTWETNIGVVKKHYFCGIQQKIPQNSNFAKKRNLNTVPNGEVAADIAKIYAIFFAKVAFLC
jgi:beta-galactosidase beta subunit